MADSTPRRGLKSAAAALPGVFYGAAGVAGLWLAAPFGLSAYYSATSGLKVRVGRVGIRKWRPVLHNVRVRSPDGVELVSMSSVSSGGSMGVQGTAMNSHFTVIFSARDLVVNSWDVVRAASWAPRIAFEGKVAISLRLNPENDNNEKKMISVVDRVTFDARRVEALRGGAVESVGFVRALTRDALRADYAHVPRELRRSARRILRERFSEDAARMRSTTLSAIGDIREAARRVDTALDGLPDLEQYREYARKTDSLLGGIASWLGGGRRNRNVRDEEERSGRDRGEHARMDLRQGYRELDE